MNRKLLRQRLGITLSLLLALGCRAVSEVRLQPTAAPTLFWVTQTIAPPTATGLIESTPTTPGSINLQNPQNFRVEYIATVYNTAFAMDKLLVYQARPIEWDGQKDINFEEISPDPAKEGFDPVFGNGMYYWDVKGKPQKGESLPFKIQFTFTAYEISTQVNPDQVQPYNQDDPLYLLYTRSEPYIESSDSQVVALANQIAAGETNPYHLARKFYDYVIDTAHYKLLGRGLLGAKELLTTSQGECGDYSALFIALSRAKGIPARPVVGYWAYCGIEQTHVWAEFYLEGLGWIPVDPTIGQSEPDKRDYYFGSMDNHRVILHKGFNISLDPVGPDDFVAALMQEPLWWFWGSSGDGNSVRIERTSWQVTPLP